ncbi:MAG: hypothetical protein ISN29_00625 [Gammaproteobacteria bacterium AqS3]|nr:hypothetical protein [Gammaproteobacteria bacterium AqS3]
MSVNASDLWCACMGTPSPPGDTIGDAMEEAEIGLVKLADALEESTLVVKMLLTGQMPIDDGLADKLSRALGSTPAFWLKRQSDYDRNLARRDFVCNGCDGAGGVRWSDDQ